MIEYDITKNGRHQSRNFQKTSTIYPNYNIRGEKIPFLSSSFIHPIPMPDGSRQCGRGNSIFALELSAKIIDGVEPAGIADLLNRIYSFGEHFICHLKSVPDKFLNRRTIHEGLETASGFTAAHISRSGKIFKRNMSAVMTVNKIKHFLQAYLIDKLNPI